MGIALASGKGKNGRGSTLTAPSALAANAASQQVTLGWTAATDSGGSIAGYYIYRNSKKVATGTSTTYTDTGLKDGTSYSYYVVAYDTSGSVSGASNTVSAMPVDTTPPTAPTSLTATPGATAVSLAWSASSDNVGVAGYDIYRDGTDVGTTTSTSYTDGGLTSGTTHSYQVVAYDAAGNYSGFSNTASATVPDPPSTPSGLTTTGVSGSAATLSWTAATSSNAIAGYNLYLDGTNVGMTSQTSYTFTGLSCGTSYTLGVSAYDTDGSGSSTATAPLTTAGCPPANTAAPTISGMTMLSQSLSASTGSWSGSPASYAYQWRRCDSSGGSCADVSGATGAAYVLSSSDVGSTVRVAVTATNSAGSATATSSATAVVGSSSVPGPIAGQAYSLVFNEDFTNFSYNNSGSINDAYTWQRPWNGANNPNAVVVDSSNILHLYSDASWAYTPFTLIATRKSPGNLGGSWTHGYFEASMKIPPGMGVYPQFWLASTNQVWGNVCSTTTSYTSGTPLLNPEIDQLEGGYEQSGWGSSGIAQYSATVHQNTGGYCGVPDKAQAQFFPSSGLSGSFHTYAVKWTSTAITFYLDGVQTVSYPAYSDMNQPMFLVLGSGIHTNYPSALPSVVDTQVAWVHVWQN